jgi:serine/threonine protein kinase
MGRVASQTLQKVGAYCILETIGRGGQATVFKGRNSATGADVAIKLVSAEVVADEKLRMRFAQECQVARMLDHPNVVRMLDFGLEGSTAYLVMEYVDGASLGQRLEDNGPLPEAEAVGLIQQVGAALQWAHAKKLVHRDVKPDNILVNASGQAKLADLGLAKNLAGDLNLTRTNTIFGTPNFMAPEQFVDAKRADALSDLYALAASLYMMLTGRVPFDAEGGLVRVYQKKLANDIEPPNQIVPGLSDQLSAAVLRGLRADRKERPGSVPEFINLLTEAAAVAGKSSCNVQKKLASVRPQATTIAVRQRAGAPPSAKESAVATENGPGGPGKVLGAVQLLLLFAVSLLPAVLGAVAAGRFFPREVELAFVPILAGLGLTCLLLWFFMGRHAGRNKT